MEQMQTHELISALADGQLEGTALARGVELAAGDAAAREAWATYHLIGDVLRSGDLAVASEPTVFLARLRQRLEQEPPLARPGANPAPQRSQAANDGNFRWKVLAGFASVAAVGAIGWSLVAGPAARSDGAQLAKAPGSATVLTSSARGLMIRDPQLDELLAAHRQLGGASALQMSAGFVRNATFESTGR